MYYLYCGCEEHCFKKQNERLVLNNNIFVLVLKYFSVKYFLTAHFSFLYLKSKADAYSKLRSSNVFVGVEHNRFLCSKL